MNPNIVGAVVPRFFKPLQNSENRLRKSPVRGIVHVPVGSGCGQIRNGWRAGVFSFLVSDPGTEMTATKTPPIKKEELEEFLKLEAERKELEQKARSIAKRTKALHDHFKVHLEAKGKSSLVRCGFRLTLVEGTPRVAWKEEFIKLEGPLKADELMQAAERPMKVNVQPNQ